MSRIRLMLMLLYCLLPVSFVHAAEVALVTEKTGSVQADLNGDNWEVELAEILPDGVAIKVSPDGSLVIIHLPTSREYRFNAEATATLTLAAVVGEKFTSGDVQLVSGDLALGQDMANQTGAVNPERVAQAAPPAPADEAKAAPLPIMRSSKLADSDSNKSGNFAEVLDEELGGSQESVESSEAAVDAFDKEQRKHEMESSSSAGASVVQPAREEKPAEEAGKIAPMPSASPAGPAAEPSESEEPLFAGLTIALPVETYSGICSDESAFKVTGSLVTGSRLNFVAAGWVEIEIDCGKMASTTLVLEGNLASITLAAVAPLPASITAAWTLEKNGYLQQAAAMWLRLLKTGVPEKKVMPHLKRLKAAISGK